MTKKTLLKDLPAADRLQFELEHHSFMADCGCRESTRVPGRKYPQIQHRGKAANLTSLLTANHYKCEVQDIPRDPTSPRQAISWLHACQNPRCIDPNHGRPGTHRENLSDSDGTLSRGPRVNQPKPIIQLDEKTGVIRTYASSAEAGRATGFAQGHISQASMQAYHAEQEHRGTRKAYGYLWFQVRHNENIRDIETMIRAGDYTITRAEHEQPA